MKSTRSNIEKNLTAWILIFSGLAGVIIGLLDIFIEIDKIFPSIKSTQEIMLMVLSIIALGLGIERFTIFNQIHLEIKQSRIYLTNEVNELRKAILRKVPIRIFTNEKEIIDETLSLIKTCEDSDIIRATDISPLTAQNEVISLYTSSSNIYFLKLAKRIKKAKDKGGSLSYRIILGEETPSVRERSINRRKDAFSSEGVLDRLLIRAIDKSWPLEIIVLGNSIILAFTSFTGDLTFFAGIRITNKILTTRITQWFDDYLWNAAKNIITKET